MANNNDQLQDTSTEETGQQTVGEKTEGKKAEGKKAEGKEAEGKKAEGEEAEWEINKVLEVFKKSFKTKLILDVGLFIYFLGTIYSIVRFAIKQDPLVYTI